MSVEKTKLSYLCKGKLDEEQMMVEAVFGAGDAQKVLWVEAVPVLDEEFVLGSDPNFSGQVYFSVIYVDQERKIREYETSAPFMGKISSANLSADARIALTAKLTSATYAEKTNKIVALISVCADFMVENEAEILCGGDEDICVKTEEISAQKLLKTDKLTFSEEINYPITDKMSNILSVSSKVYAKNVIAGENLFTISGEICTTIKYITLTDDLETISTVNFTEPFRREVEVGGLTENGIVEGYVCVDRGSYKYELDKETNKILIVVPIKLAFRACDEIVLPYVVDAFCLEKQISVISASFSKSNLLPTEFFENKLEGSVQIDENAPRIDKVVGFSNPILAVSAVELAGEKIYVECLATFDVAYLNDETNSIISSAHQIPFKVSGAVDVQKADLTLVAGEIVDADIVARRGREIFFDGKLKLVVSAKTDGVDAVITEIEEKEPLPKKNYAIEIYFGKQGDDLWDIAKELKVQPSIITQQNPDIVLPLEQSENIVVYNGRTKNQ